MAEKEATRNGISSIGSILLLSVLEGKMARLPRWRGDTIRNIYSYSRERPTLYKCKPGSLNGVAQHHPELGSTESLRINVFGATGGNL